MNRRAALRRRGARRLGRGRSSLAALLALLTLGIALVGPAGGAPAPSISINDVTQAEGDSGNTSFTFAVTLSGPGDKTVKVRYEAANRR